MKVLVTGGAGFIGSHLVSQISNFGHDIIIVDDLSTGNIGNFSNIPINVEFTQTDFIDERFLDDTLPSVDTIIHLAAKTSVEESITNPNDYYINNFRKTVELFTRSRGKRFIFASSASVYGESDQPVDEEFNRTPKTPYAFSKACFENFLDFDSIFNDYSNVTVLRFFNVYGPKQNPNYGAVIPKFIKSALNNENLIIHGDGEQIRDFVYVEDVARAIAHTMNIEGGGIYNIGNGVGTTIRDLAEKIIDLTGSSSKIVFEDGRKGDIQFSISNNDKILKSGFEFVNNFDQGLIKTIQFYDKENFLG